MATDVLLTGVEFKTAAAKPPKRHFFQAGIKPGVVGVIDPCYGSSHVIYGLESQRYTHETVRIAPLKRLDRNSTFFQFTPLVLDNSIALLHTWNAIPLNKDFIISFELELPRYLFGPSTWQVRFALKLLRSRRCKKILALSDFAFRTAARRMQDHGFGDLVEKMDVFRGAVRDPLTTYQLPPRPVLSDFSRQPFTAVVIGTELFRKGGMYSILAFERLRAAGYNVTLTLIGDFEQDSYAFGECIPDAGEWRARARSHDWIRLEGPIPNRQVFVELRKHHVCLYPTLDESLGWLPIEAQMCEVPILGNAMCAFPELVDDRQTGWLTPLPLAQNERWIGIDTPAEIRRPALETARELVTQGIFDCVSMLYKDPGMILRWGHAGRKKALAMYGMEAARVRLEQIYDAAKRIG